MAWARSGSVQPQCIHRAAATTTCAESTIAGGGATDTLLQVRRMRRSSIILAVASVIVPFAWAYLSTSACYERARQEGVYVCGLQALAGIVLACFGSSIMSAAALTLGAVAYRRLPSPRPPGRRIELASLALLLILFGIYATLLLFA
jgi:hypothetical protein